MARPQSDSCGTSSMPQQGHLDEETIRMVQMILEKFKSCDCAECKKPLGHQSRLEPHIVLCSSACLASFEGKHKDSSRKDTGTLTVPCDRQDAMTSYSQQNIQPPTGDDARMNGGELIISNQAMAGSTKTPGSSTDDVQMIEEVDQKASNYEVRENLDFMQMKVENFNSTKSPGWEPEVVLEVTRNNIGPSNSESASREKSKDKYPFQSIRTSEVKARNMKVAGNEALRMNSRIENGYEEPRRNEVVQCEEPSKSRAPKQSILSERRVEMNTGLPVSKTREGNPPVEYLNQVRNKYLSKYIRPILHKAPSQPPSSSTQNHIGTTVVREHSDVGVLKRLPGECAVDWILSRCILAKPDEVNCIIYDKTGQFIITGGDNGLVMVWNDTTRPKKLAGGRGKIVDIAINVENSMVVAGSTDGFVVIWSLQTFSVVATLSRTILITTVGFCPMPGGQKFRNYLMVTATNCSVHFWPYYQTPAQDVFFDDIPTVYEEKLRPGRARIICSSFSSGGVFLAVGAADKHVRVYYMLGRDGPERIMEEECHEARVDCISFAHTGLKFVSGSRDGTAILHKFEYGLWRKTRMEYKSQSLRKNQRVTMVAWNLDDSQIVTAHEDGVLQLWNARKGNPSRCLVGHSSYVHIIKPHPIIPSLVLSAGEDGKVILWEVVTPFPCVERGSGRRRVTELISEESSPVKDCKISPDGKGCATIKASGEVLIFSEASPACAQEAAYALRPNEYAIPVLPPNPEHVTIREEEYYRKHLNLSLIDLKDGAVDKNRLSCPSNAKRIKFSNSEEIQITDLEG